MAVTQHLASELQWKQFYIANENCENLSGHAVDKLLANSKDYVSFPAETVHQVFTIKLHLHFFDELSGPVRLYTVLHLRQRRGFDVATSFNNE